MSTEQAIIDSFFQQVPFTGWTQASVKATGRHLGINDKQLKTILPDGVRSVLDLLHEQLNAELSLKAKRIKSFSKLRVHEKIEQLLSLRFSLLQPHHTAMRQLMDVASRPSLAPHMLRLVWSSADHIWHLAGDHSTDFNYYSKRMLLAGVYMRSLKFWLKQEPTQSRADDAALSAYIKTRLQEVLAMGKKIAVVKNMAQKTGDKINQQLKARA